MLRNKFAKYLLLAAVSLANSTVIADEAPKAAVEKKKPPTKEELMSKEYLSRLAQSYGHMIYNGLSNPFLTMSADDVIKGINDAKEGKPLPIAEREYADSLQRIQQIINEEQEKKQIDEAEKFLKENCSQEGVVELVPGKVQYKIIQAGSGDMVVTDKTLPTVNYSATFLNGTQLGSSDQHGNGLEIDLSDCIQGFSTGIKGMKVGEKRRLYIHPEYAYGNAGKMNGLVIFDIEVLKIAEKKEESDTVDSNKDEKAGTDSTISTTDEEIDETGDDDDESDFDSAEFVARWGGDGDDNFEFYDTDSESDDEEDDDDFSDDDEEVDGAQPDDV